jgi:hypothetical protein
VQTKIDQAIHNATKGMSQALFGVIGGILGATAGAILGATIGWISSTRHGQAEALFEMHREYHGDAMVKARDVASRALTANPTATFLTLRKTVGPDQMKQVLSIVYFYERLWMAMKYGYVNGKPVPELFGSSFYWWFTKYLQKQFVPLDEPTAHHISDLYKWLMKNSSKSEKAEWLRYLKIYEGL